MPLKMRCRCGQEVSLRYSEWVYLLVGFLVLVLAVNVIVLVLIYSHLRDVASDATAARPAEPAQVEAVGSVTEPAPPAPTRVAEAAPEPESTRVDPAPVRPPEVSPPAKPDESPASSPPPADSSGAVPVQTSIGSEEGEARPKAIDLREGLVEALDDPPRTPSDSDVHETDGDGGARVEERVIMPGLPPALRYLMADGLGGPPTGALRAALRLDPEPRVRDRIGRSPGPETGAAIDSGSDDASGESFWTRARVQLEGRLRAEPELAAAMEQLAVYGDAVDVVLAIDVTESMDGAFGVLRTSAAGALDALLWTLPDARLGALLYRDEVVASAPLSESAEGIVELLRGESARGGGGDVPEGVYPALRSAYELGRFSWRREATKIVVVIGDAPPPFERKDALIGLAAQARRHARFTTHTLGLRAWEGFDGVPFFAELAAAGGGMARTVAADRVTGELLEMLVPAALLKSRARWRG